MFSSVHYVKIVDTIWVPDADLSFAPVHCVKIVDAIWVLDANLSFARAQCVKIVDAMRVCWMQIEALRGFIASE